MSKQLVCVGIQTN